ncbi:MAG: DUF721 domain-containing protein [Alphaproteobacteria bacterium]|nr:DUF721 domain-containing protein [Alphaproteobacteria bacterium]
MQKRRGIRPDEPGSVPHLARESERRQGFRAVGVAVSTLAMPIISKRGGGVLVRLKAHWATIIGDEFASTSWPSALGRDGALKLRTAPAAALELQHRAPLLIDRINLFFGRTVVNRLVLVQGPLPTDSPPTRPGLRSLAANEVAELDLKLAEIADPELRAALARLGKAMISQN